MIFNFDKKSKNQNLNKLIIEGKYGGENSC